MLQKSRFCYIVAKTVRSENIKENAKLVGELAEDLVGDIVEKKLYYGSKTDKLR